MSIIKMSSVLKNPQQFVKQAQIDKQSPAYIRMMSAIQQVPEDKRHVNNMALMLDGAVFYLTLDQLAFHLSNDTPLGYVIVRDANKLEEEMSRNSTI